MVVCRVTSLYLKLKTVLENSNVATRDLDIVHHLEHQHGNSRQRTFWIRNSTMEMVGGAFGLSLILTDLLNIVTRTMKTHDVVPAPLEGFASLEALLAAASSGTGPGSTVSPEPKITCS